MKVLDLIRMLISYIVSLFSKPEPKPEPSPTPEPKPDVPKPDVPKPIPVPGGVILLNHDNELLVEHNKVRDNRGKNPLVINDKLTLAAQKHAIWMARYGTLSHYRMSGRVNDEGYRGNIAENVAYGQDSAKSVTSTWKWSPGHYINMTGSYKDVGFGAASKDGVIYWCAIFGTQRK